MSEKDDIMGLAFIVGGAINDLKRNTLGDGKFISDSLPDPASFVRKIAAQDITPAVQQARIEAIKNMQSGAPEAQPQAQPQTNIQNNSSNDFLILLSLVNDLLVEVKKITSKLEQPIIEHP